MGGKARVSLWQDDVTGVPKKCLLGKPMFFFLSLQKYKRQISLQIYLLGRQIMVSPVAHRAYLFRRPCVRVT